ncbi:MAG TPA: efflux RND transporter permease subunit [Verrucomicrobiae bacterium]|nr:efflux RND transporter permease subunit [Verrucomicrobiae bacterium]
MNFSQFFIRRPIFAAVLSIVIVLVGLIAMGRLPIAQYPEIVPPTVVVRAVYPGANPRVLAETVATPIEQEVNGVENMLYMSSTSTSDGVMNLTITFKLGTDLNTAQVLVQNRVAIALPKLPEDVRRLGVTTTKKSSDLTMVAHLVSPDGSRDDLYLGNYAFLQVRDQIARIQGVGDVTVFGARDYSMRIWLDPEKLATRNLTAGDVVRSIREQNLQVAAGNIAQPPVPSGSDFQFTISTQGRLLDEQEFGEIVVKQGSQGQVTKVRDVARVELAARDYSVSSQLSGKPAAALVIFQLPGSNAIETSDGVRAKLEELKKNFPPGVDYRVIYDTTVFARESIEAVIHTLFEAVLLVVVVVIVFLQSWRASIIPLLAVPVALIGTLAVMLAFGFSLNNLSLFGLVLAIGIVVDDAIVVVENVERNIEAGLAPIPATEKAMREVSGPVIAVALVLCAVFVPTAFVSGITGQFYRQFALTIAVSTVISAFNSLTLSPALSAILLKGAHAPKDWFARGMDLALGWFFRLFNKAFDATNHGYSRAVGGAIRRGGIALLLYAGLLVVTWGGFKTVPTGFIPTLDSGYLILFAQLPDGASLERTKKIIDQAGEFARAIPGVKGTVEFPGYNVLVGANLPNAGTMFVSLDNFEDRRDPKKSARSILGQLTARCAQLRDARVLVLPPPPVRGLGSVAGFKMMIQDRSDLGLDALAGAAFRMMVSGNQAPRLAQAFTTFTTRVPQIYVDVDRVKAKSMNVALSDVNDTLQIYLGSLYVNDFNRFGRTYQVTAQADAKFRLQPDDITKLKTRNAAGDMLPLGTLVDVHETTGPDKVIRYNMYPAADINGVAKPGVSSGQAIAVAQQLAAKELPPGMTYEWTDLTFQEIMAGNTIVFIFPLCVLLVFLALSAQYESWSMPLAIILIVPMCLLSSIAGIWLRHMDNNIFTQIGLIVLVGLASKNAILIVEFARQLEEAGKGPVEAAIEAAHLRLRPILMTSFAFILGVVPLVIAHGAGAEMRQAIGTAVFFGMLGVTFFGLFLTPVFYVVIRKITTRTKPADAINQGSVPAIAHETH